MTNNATAIARTKNTVNAPTPGEISNCSGVSARRTVWVMTHSSILQIDRFLGSMSLLPILPAPTIRTATPVVQAHVEQQRRSHQDQSEWREPLMLRLEDGNSPRIPRGWLPDVAGVYEPVSTTPQTAKSIPHQSSLDARF